jgi:hypothetical protein
MSFQVSLQARLLVILLCGTCVENLSALLSYTLHRSVHGSEGVHLLENVSNF